MRRLLVFILFILILCSCGKEVQTGSLKLSASGAESGKDGGSLEICVYGSPDWITDNTHKWISIDKKGQNAVITILPNPGAWRESTFHFISGKNRAPFTVSQERSDIFTVNTSNITSSYKGGSFLVDVVCYDTWKISGGDGWVITDKQESDKPETIELTVLQSFDMEARETSINFVCGDRIHTLTVTQDPSPYIALEKDVVEIDGDGGILKVLYISNTDVTISTDDSWIRLVDNGTDVKMAVFEVSRNLSVQREGHIRITSTSDSDYFKTLTIKQGEKVDHPKISFTEGPTLMIKEKGSFLLQPVLEDMKNTALTWTSESPQTASVDAEGRVTVHTGGTCTITVKNSFHGVSASIMLEIKLMAESMGLMLGMQDMTANPTAVRFPGEVLEVQIRMLPEDAYSGDAVCISSDPSVVSVSGMTLTCLKPGAVTVSVESLYQNIRSSFTIIVLED